MILLPVNLYNELIFVQCDFMDGRDAFLTMARDKHYEFSSLRRCKYSTLVMLYELHTQVRELMKRHDQGRLHSKLEVPGLTYQSGIEPGLPWW
jgi:hypothetical protein